LLSILTIYNTSNHLSQVIYTQNFCYLYAHHSNTYAQVHTHVPLPFYADTATQVERRALILMLISNLGFATVLRGDSRKHNEVSRDRPTMPISYRPTGARIQSCIPAPINFKNAPPFIISRHPVRLMVTDSPWRSRSDLVRATASRMRHHFSYRPTKYDALLIALVEIPVSTSRNKVVTTKKVETTKRVENSIFFRARKWYARSTVNITQYLDRENPQNLILILLCDIHF